MLFTPSRITLTAPKPYTCDDPNHEYDNTLASIESVLKLCEAPKKSDMLVLLSFWRLVLKPLLVIAWHRF